MYASVSRLRIPEDRAGALVRAFRGRSGLVDGWDGFVDLQVWRSDRDPGALLMVSRWRDREAFKAYMRSSDHQVSHGRIDPELKHVIKLERLEHLHTGRSTTRSTCSPGRSATSRATWTSSARSPGWRGSRRPASSRSTASPG
ncbi:MAG TPA: antibiotic biosynthesis monooxygenase family protein, partial [Solirubrobacteraceae bacterium]|nr:antibiotic biosynthesis monooxygenase family protein [Solirubrobacteraceae bacterium]